MKIILINGKKRSGKDHLARLLKTELDGRGLKTEIMSFAGPLKDIVCDTFEISQRDLDFFKNNSDEYIIRWSGPNGSGDLGNFRTILQNLGTDAIKRQFGDDVWVTLLQKKVQHSTASVVLVPDFRFECEAISDCTIHVFDEELQDKDQHLSENGLNDFNFKYYVNNTGKPDLREAAKELVDLEFSGTKIVEF